MSGQSAAQVFGVSAGEPVLSLGVWLDGEAVSAKVARGDDDEEVDQGDEGADTPAGPGPGLDSGPDANAWDAGVGSIAAE